MSEAKDPHAKLLPLGSGEKPRPGALGEPHGGLSPDGAPGAWRIDRLVLQGFKSFADRTALDFPDPVTGIIGPNGSGKSNLVEALRFVTGARAQELRGQELRSFLFQGGEGRPSQGVAEVRLELSRGRERLVVERRIEGSAPSFG